MKVAFYINVLSGGGAERVITNLASAFAENGHDVLMIVSYTTPNEYPLHKKVKKYILDNKNVGNVIARNISRIKKLRKILKLECPQVIISFMAEPNFRTILAAGFLKTKVIVSVRNDPEKEYPNYSFKTLARLLYSFANKVVFQTPDAQHWFPMYIQKKSHIIYNPINPVFYNCILQEDRRDFVTAGRLTVQKNHSLLIKAFKKIEDKVSGNLIIYGEGEERKHLQNLINDLNLEDRICLPGNSTNIVENLANALVFVLSSDYEGMPNALMEAMAMGLACISTDCPCGGSAILIRDNQNGLLVPVNNEEALGNAMLLLAEDTKKRCYFEKRAKETSNLFTIDVIYKTWLQLVESII